MRWDRSKGRPEPIAALNRIIEAENGDPLVEINSIAPELLIYRDRTIPYLRKRVVEMAAEADTILRSQGLRLAITDAWRPLERQIRIHDWVTKCIVEVNPGIPYAALRRRANRWAAPPHEKAPPGHCTGAALDVLLLRSESDSEVDVCAPYSRFRASPTYTLGLTPEAQSNRMALVEAMLAVGFSNCRDEWWHYSYGDAGWSVRMGLDTCCYGLVELHPESIYQEHEKAWMKEFETRPNPFKVDYSH